MEWDWPFRTKSVDMGRYNLVLGVTTYVTIVDFNSQFDVYIVFRHESVKGRREWPRFESPEPYPCSWSGIEINPIKRGLFTLLRQKQNT